ncbi:unnamed protein product [Hymenolepis diminuta]|uniref:Uncharacterized protein n=1 Tax=Hymenolepis diminuta TaxID=6216 RepID=A0A564Y5I3_HYMDI|nr:unnamed protein product [Hymenolepis diminuta]
MHSRPRARPCTSDSYKLSLYLYTHTRVGTSLSCTAPTLLSVLSLLLARIPLVIYSIYVGLRNSSCPTF